MAVKVTIGRISDGTISKNTCIEEYHLCGKFHGFMKKCTIFWLCRYTTSATIMYDSAGPEQYYNNVAQFFQQVFSIPVPLKCAVKNGQKHIIFEKPLAHNCGFCVLTC